VTTYEQSLKALADPTRRAMLEILRGGPLSVGVLAERLPVSRPAVSQHLKALQDAGLVRARRDGTRRLYEVDPSGLIELQRYLDTFWSVALAAFKSEAEREEGDP
jgi:DNA-binding transcriptional ArsR family regulator